MHFRLLKHHFSIAFFGVIFCIIDYFILIVLFGTSQLSYSVGQLSGGRDFDLGFVLFNFIFIFVITPRMYVLYLWYR